MLSGVLMLLINRHIVYMRWKARRHLLSDIRIEVDDDDFHIDIDEEPEREPVLRPLLGGVPNSILIPRESYRSPVFVHHRQSSLENSDQILIRISSSSLQCEDNPLPLELSFMSIAFQIMPILHRWSYLSAWKRIEYVLLLPIIFAFGTR